MTTTTRTALAAGLLCWTLGLAVGPRAALAVTLEEVVVLAVMQDKAVFRIAGERRVLEAGETSPEGVLLVDADTDGVTVEIDGRREYLAYGPVRGSMGAGGVEPAGGDDPPRVVLWSSADGFFHAEGAINGYPVRFLVDTGASSIALSSQLARRIGLDLSGAEQGYANTAGGITRVARVTLDEVTLGSITLRDLEAGVIMGAHPRQPLLGMSFLGELDMERSGNRMELIKRY